MSTHFGDSARIDHEAQRRAAYLAEVRRADASFEAAKARGDESAAFYWSLQRSAALRLLPIADRQLALALPA